MAFWTWRFLPNFRIAWRFLPYMAFFMFLIQKVYDNIIIIYIHSLSFFVAFFFFFFQRQLFSIKRAFIFSPKRSFLLLELLSFYIHMYSQKMYSQKNVFTIFFKMTGVLDLTFFSKKKTQNTGVF